jgi:hypothetical protein
MHIMVRYNVEVCLLSVVIPHATTAGALVVHNRGLCLLVPSEHKVFPGFKKQSLPHKFIKCFTHITPENLLVLLFYSWHSNFVETGCFSSQKNKISQPTE